ncbi:MAG: lysophospholipid acyltransferase family protein [Pseudomonadota bacterium]
MHIKPLLSCWHKTIHQIHRIPCLISYVLGGMLGFLVALLRRELRQRAELNVAQSGCLGISDSVAPYKISAYRILFNAGVVTFDTLLLWFFPWKWCKDWVTDIQGWESVQAARQAAPQRGILFLTPHLGCFEMAAAWVGHQQPLTSMYRAPRQRWLDTLMKKGRQQGKNTLVPADLKGVRALLKVLKRGGDVGLLPDQVPRQGEGMWASFFGRPAYTATLAARLRQVTQAHCVMVIAERLPGGKGICLHFELLAETAKESSLESAVQEINQHVEAAIRRFPEQYLWGYNRYKRPAGVELPKN